MEGEEIDEMWGEYDIGGGEEMWGGDEMWGGNEILGGDDMDKMSEGDEIRV